MDPSGHVDGGSALERQGQDTESPLISLHLLCNTPKPTVRTSGRVRFSPARMNGYLVYR